MVVKIRPEELALLNELASESNSINGSGLQTQSLTPVATSICPVPNYYALVLPGSEYETKVKDGAIALLAPIVRRISQINLQTSNVLPSISIGGDIVDLLSYSIPDSFEVQRTVEVSVNGTCYSDTTSNRIDFWADVNGYQPSQFKMFFNESGSHRTFCGSWILTLPANVPVTIKLRAVRGYGSGSIIFNSDDFINMTIRG